MLPRYFVDNDLRARRLASILPRVEPLADWFRLVVRHADPRRSAFERLAAAMRAQRRADRLAGTAGPLRLLKAISDAMNAHDAKTWPNGAELGAQLGGAH